MKRQITLILIITIFISCSNKKQHIQDTLKIQTDSLDKYAKKEFRLIDFKINDDTLKLISSSDFLDYPFGKYLKTVNFKKALPLLTKMELNKTDKDICKFIYKSSYIKTFLSKSEDELSKKTVWIVYAKIKDKEIALINGIKLEISKKEFLSKFFDQIPDDISKINVIELIRGLDGVWQYYDFKEDKLIEIHFDSDYTIDKN